MTNDDRMIDVVTDLIQVIREANERMESLESAIRDSGQFDIVFTEENTGSLQ